MSSDRNRLLIMGGPKAGDPLPWDVWAEEFADRLPPEIVKAIADARAGEADTDMDESWRERLAERFGRRWRQLRFIADKQGDKTAEPDQPGGMARPTSKPHRPKRRRSGESGGGGRTGSVSVGSKEVEEGTPSRQRQAAVGLPKAEWKPGDEFAPGIFAIWNPPSAANPDGLVQLNLEHPVFKEEVLHWAPQYPTHRESEVIEVIKNTYAQLAVATIAHSESLRVHLERREELDKMRTPEALTASLLGLVGAAAIMGPTLGGAFGRRRSRSREETVTE